MKKACTLCGCFHYNMFAFKTGHVCEDCLKQLKTDAAANNQVRLDY